jgi:hypothetical protein
MKKSMVIVLITILAWSAFGSFCFAQLDRTMTNTSKKGSLLIWPLIKVGSADTVIKLNNEYYQGVKVRCSYRTVYPCDHADWVLTLLPNQPISWLASTGKGMDGKSIPGVTASPPPLASGTLGELRCWAVDSTESHQIAWNWLSGNAILREGANQHWEYSAWRFAVNASTTGAYAGTAGKMLLTGDSGNYDACPTGLLFNIMEQTSSAEATFVKGTVNNVLTLVPCGEDLAGESYPIVYTELLVHDEYQAEQSGTNVCVGCVDRATQWFSESLLSSKLNIAASKSNPFIKFATPGGSIYIHGRQQSRECPESTGVPLLGVMSKQLFSNTGPFVGETPTAVGPGQAYVRDSADQNTSNPVSITWK